jgi:hypothetical protein
LVCYRTFIHHNGACPVSTRADEQPVVHGHPQGLVPSGSRQETKEGAMIRPPDGEPPAQQTLLQRLRSSYVSASLTLLSIIQGVALAALGATVAAHAGRLTVAQWLMVGVTFGALMVVWTQVSVDTMTWVMVPDLQLTLVPFSVGALELVLVGAITINLSLWLFGATLLITFSSVGLLQVARRAGQEPENAQLFARLRGLRRAAHLYNLVGVVLYGLLGVGSLVGWFSRVDAAVSVPAAAEALAGALAGLWVVGWLLRSFAYWHTIVVFAHTGR